jgi:hypothetical protein
MDLLAWLQLLALDGKLARAEPATIRDSCSTSPPGSPTTPAAGN